LTEIFPNILVKFFFGDTLYAHGMQREVGSQSDSNEHWDHHWSHSNVEQD